MQTHVHTQGQFNTTNLPTKMILVENQTFQSEFKWIWRGQAEILHLEIRTETGTQELYQCVVSELCLLKLIHAIVASSE